MKVPVSKAEYLFFQILSEKRLTCGMLTQHTIIMSRENEECTIPDFYWPADRLAVYIDGPVHKGKRLDKDEKINQWLEEHGIEYIRFSYKGQLTRTKALEWASEVGKYITPYDLHQMEAS
jgi:very-short-patch-repair endonuclease